MITKSEINKLKRKIESWGGELIIQERNNFHLPCAPFNSNLGLNFRGKKIYIYNLDKVSFGDVIHEMGHCFATKSLPNKSEEWNFFGWEYALVKNLRLSIKKWIENNSAYMVQYKYLPNILNSKNLFDFGDLNKNIRSSLLKERVAYAKKIKIVNKNNEAIAIR